MSVFAAKEGLVPRLERNGSAKPLDPRMVHAAQWSGRCRSRVRESLSMNRDTYAEGTVP